MNALKRYQKDHPPPPPDADPEALVPQVGIFSVILLLLILGLTQCIAGCPPSNTNHGVQVPQQCRQWLFSVAESGPTLSLLLANPDGQPQTVLTFARDAATPTASTASPPTVWLYRHDTANMLTDSAPSPSAKLTALSPKNVCLSIGPEDTISDPCLEQQARQGTLCFTLKKQ